MNLGYKLEEMSVLPRHLECLVHDKNLVQEDLGDELVNCRRRFTGSYFLIWELFSLSLFSAPRVPSMSLEYKIACGAALGLSPFRHPSFSTTLHFYLFINGMRET